MVTLGRRPKPPSKPTNRIGVTKRMESSATRRGGSPPAPRGLLLHRCRDLRRCDDLSQVATAAWRNVQRPTLNVQRPTYIVQLKTSEKNIDFAANSLIEYSDCHERH